MTTAPLLIWLLLSWMMAPWQGLAPTPGGLKGYSGGGGGITFDVAGAGAQASTSTITAAHTVTASLANSVVVGILSCAGAGASISGMTYDGNAMTQMWNFRETAAAYVLSAGFIKINGTGDGASHNVVATLGFTSDCGLITLSYGGVNQTTPSRTAYTLTYDYTSTPGTAALTAANAQSGDVVIDGISILLATAPTTSQTSRATQANIQGSNFSNASSSANATGSTNMSYTFATGERYAAMGAAALIPQ